MIVALAVDYLGDLSAVRCIRRSIPSPARRGTQPFSLNRWRRLWFPVLLLCPLALAVLAMVGYLLTAVATSYGFLLSLGHDRRRRNSSTVWRDAGSRSSSASWLWPRHSSGGGPARKRRTKGINRRLHRKPSPSITRTTWNWIWMRSPTSRDSCCGFPSALGLCWPWCIFWSRHLCRLRCAGSRRVAADERPQRVAGNPGGADRDRHLRRGAESAWPAGTGRAPGDGRSMPARGMPSIPFANTV